MSVSQTVLVLDIGTSSAKAVLFDLDGTVLGEQEAPYATQAPRAGWEEQNPLDWWNACRTAARALDLSTVALISMAGTMQSVIPVTGEGEPVRSAILYSDSRATETFSRIAPALAQIGAAGSVGNHLTALMAVFKMAWMQEHQPGLAARTSIFHSGAKDFVLHRLTGEHVTDPTAATTVGLMDIRTRAWSGALADAAGIPLHTLPRIEPANSEVGPLLQDAAKALGLRAGIPVINGCGDAGAATLGSGVSRPGDAYVYLGTSAWAGLVGEVETLSLPHDLYTLAHPDSGLAIRVGAMLSGGDSAAWFSEISHASFDELEKQLAEIDRTPPDVLFLPYLKGERCPFQDSRVRGAFLGLDRAHRSGELFYAVLEGVALALTANLTALGVSSEEIRLIGGGAASAMWPQLIADISARSVVVTRIPTAATALGAFCVAAGKLGNTPAFAQFSQPVHPRPERTERAGHRRHLFNEVTQFARALAQL